MKRIGILLTFALAAGFMLSLTSCKTPRMKKLEEENAKLQDDIVKSDSVQIQFMNAYAEIEANLNEIKLREKMINDASQDAEDNADIQQRIITDIVQIGKLMESNRQKLQEMEKLRRQLVSLRSTNKKLKAEVAELKEGAPMLAPTPAPKRESPAVKVVSNPQDQQRIDELTKETARLNELNKAYEKQINDLKNKLSESEARVESLQEELALLKDAYAALQAVNDSLQAGNAAFLAQLEEKDGQISALTAQLSNSNAVYYLVADGKTIKSKGLSAKKALNPDAVNPKDFTKVDDMSELSVIETKSGKVTILSQHPAKSYEFDAKDPKNVKIVIKNAKAFWGVSRVCLVEVK